jgi:hypothetical protein
VTQIFAAVLSSSAAGAFFFSSSFYFGVQMHMAAAIRGVRGLS